jgi:hypothetical protein
LPADRVVCCCHFTFSVRWRTDQRSPLRHPVRTTLKQDMSKKIQIRRYVVHDTGGELMIDTIGSIVEVNDSTVFLIGHVENFAEKSAAAKAADQTRGVCKN